MPSRHIVIPCSGLTELFFSESLVDRKVARQVCVDCPVRMKCLAGAIRRKERFGVWGGKDFQSRKRRPTGKVSGTTSQGGAA